MERCQFITDAATWTTHVQKQPLDIFYSHQYVTLNARPSEQAVLFLYEGHAGTLFYPFLKRRIFDTPYSDLITPYGYGGPEIIGRLTASEIQQARLSFERWAEQESIVSEMIRFNPLTGNERFMQDWTKVSFIRHTTSIDLRPSLEDIMQTFHKKTRSMIRKSLASPLTVRTGTRDDLPVFLALYHETMDRKNASAHYYFTATYFEQLMETNPLCEPLLLMAEIDGKAVGGYFVLLGKEYAHGHLIGCKRDEAKMFPNQRLEYEAILQAKARGLVEQHLGGGYQERDSLFESKCRYTGYRLFEYHQGKSILQPSLYDLLCIRYGSNADSDYFPAYRQAGIQVATS
ncbi:peptidoglycan bridge formation glycyltransferase FemA/FemB family protein [Exiguobacterium sp. UBA3968]|uniref:peptidoglycan bridge formation glycyltransferase FemA/FemB family protein n=1 Tax=unclassified Exiguobacterium TaxID=2644629 RepID=UPI0025B7A7D7|nr:peptidoglycan bridge formation glycyltransferase FemA/FemB family protein [Exiguobacterium sp. UBA3968]